MLLAVEELIDGGGSSSLSSSSSVSSVSRSFYTTVMTLTLVRTCIALASRIS
jgi:hypothetical protein